VADAVVAFETSNSQIEAAATASSVASPSPTPILTDRNGHFTATLLVKKLGSQQARVTWNTVYSAPFSFTLPEQPGQVEQNVSLPINYAPFKITNVLGQSMAGVGIQLSKMNQQGEPQAFLAAPLGDGIYEAREILDGVYTMNIQKAGYQQLTGNFSVNGGERAPEQTFVLPHYVTIHGVVMNGKGIGVQDAEVKLIGQNSQLLYPEKAILTDAEGRFQIDVLVTGAGQNGLKEHIEITWNDPAHAEPGQVQTEAQHPFTMDYDFTLPPIPKDVRLGLLALPANFYPVVVQDISGQGLTGVTVIFTDETGRAFPAQELASGSYEGQNLPNGVYTIKVAKDGYQAAQTAGLKIASAPETAPLPPEALTFKLPYYVTLEGIAVNGKGAELASDLTLTLDSQYTVLAPEAVQFEPSGHFSARLLVNAVGQENVQISWQGTHGVHVRRVPFWLPDAPQTVDLGRVSLPVNFIPIEVKDLMGAGLDGATVTLRHVETETDLIAQDVGHGMYAGENLLDGSYQIMVTKDGYKPAESDSVSVAGGIVSETTSFRLPHYVQLTGILTNGNGEGLRDPLIAVQQINSRQLEIQSDLSGKFQIQLEVHEIGAERITVTWRNGYETHVVLTLPAIPTVHDLGEVRLPINFLSMLVSDISGSTLSGAEISVRDRAGVTQHLKTDHNGFCKTDDLPDGEYQVEVARPGYQTEMREVSLKGGKTFALRFTLPHYVTIKGYVKDIMQNPVGAAEVIFDEFYDARGQKLRTTTDAKDGTFEQQLLINHASYLERQKGHFQIVKNGLFQPFTFKIPAVANQVISYKMLVFPTNYFYGKVLDKAEPTIPLEGVSVSLIPVVDLTLAENQDSGAPGQNEPATPAAIQLTTNSLGVFQASELKQGEYKITLQKDGYVTHEDFIQISGMLQSQEFLLRK